MRAVLRHRPTQAGLLLGAVAAAGLQASRLTAIHGVESAVALGVLLPPAVALTAASWVAEERARAAPELGRALRLAALAAVLQFALPLGLLALASLFVRNCTPVEGLAFMLLGPGFGVGLALPTGLLAGLAVRQRGLRRALAVVPPLLGVALAVHGFLSSPAVFFYGHYFGYFPGAIYDELVGLPAPLVFMRLATAAWIAAAWCVVIGATGGRLRLTRGASRPWALLAAATCAIFGLGLDLHRPELGIGSNQAHIREVLGATHNSERCHLILPREYPDKARLGADCDFRVRQMEDFFGLRQPGAVRVYLFRSAAEKRALMGAARTNIAKPWRREIYLQVERWPHPIMAHEVAHIVAGNAGVGPLRIAGSFGGLWPNPGLIEGVAVAADFRGTQGLSPHQWARAALQLDRAPPLSHLLGAGFLATNKRLAYVMAGSFLRFLRDTRGRAVVRHIYQRGEVAAVVGRPLSELETEWHAFLRGVQLPEQARALATQRFTGRSVLSSICPHRVAALRQQLGRDLAAGDEGRAVRTCRRVLEVDPRDTATRAQLAALLADAGSPGLTAELDRLAELGADLALAHARHAVADAQWRAGDLPAARTAYAALLAEPQAPDARRLLRVKHAALSGSAKQAALLRALLLGDGAAEPAGPALAIHLVRALREERSDGLPHYLEARQLYYAHAPARAAAMLDESLAAGLPGAELTREAMRLSALCHQLAGHDAVATARWRSLAALGGPAERYMATDFLSRLAMQR